MTPEPSARAKPLVLYDGECDFCERFARWVRRRDRAGALDVLAFQRCPAPPMTTDLHAACTQAVHVIRRDGLVLRGGRAALFILDRLGYRRIARTLALPPFLWVVEAGYGIVARNRGRLARLIP